MECHLADSKFAPVVTITSQQKVGKRPRVLKGIALQMYSSLLLTSIGLNLVTWLHTREARKCSL